MPHATLGTLLRSLLDELDSAVADAYANAGLAYKPRFTPIIRTLARLGPMRIKDIADGTGISHSAVSQTVSALVAGNWVVLKPGLDNRERIVHLTKFALAKMPRLERHWAVTAEAAASLSEDIGLPLEQVLRRALGALADVSFAERLERADSSTNGMNGDRVATPDTPKTKRTRKIS